MSKQKTCHYNEKTGEYSRMVRRQVVKELAWLFDFLQIEFGLTVTQARELIKIYL